MKFSVKPHNYQNNVLEKFSVKPHNYQNKAPEKTLDCTLVIKNQVVTKKNQKYDNILSSQCNKKTKVQ